MNSQFSIFLLRLQKFKVQIFLSLFVSSLVFVSILPLGLLSQPLGVSLLDSPQTIAEKFGFGDSGSYLKAALELSEVGGLTPDKLWVINLWPPGMVWINGVLIEIFGAGYALSYALLVASTWSIFISFFAIMVWKNWGLGVAVLASALLLSSGPFQSWIFSNGLFYAEGFAQIFFLMSLISLIKGVRAENNVIALAYGLSGGSFLAIAAFFRASFSTLETLILVAAVLVSIVWGFSLWFSEAAATKAYLFRLSLSLSTFWVSMYLLMYPWLEFTANEIRGVRSWSVVGETFLRGVWVSREDQPSFLAGIGWGCELNPSFCEKISQYQSSTGQPYPLEKIVSEIFSTILSNPLAYIADRFEFFFSGWFSVESAMGSWAFVSGFVSLMAFTFFLVELFRRILQGEYVLVFVFAMMVLLTVPQMIGHIEPRYFLPLKLLVITYPWLFLPSRGGKSTTSTNISGSSQH